MTNKRKLWLFMKIKLDDVPDHPSVPIRAKHMAPEISTYLALTEQMCTSQDLNNFD